MSTESMQFEWPEGNPSNEAEFDRLMWALDKHLAEQRGQPLHRLMGFYIEDALREARLDCGVTYAWRSESAREPGYAGEPLVAKAYRWYGQVYGVKVSGRNAVADMWSSGFFPAMLGNEAVWKVRIPIRTMGWPHVVCDAEDFKGSEGDSYVRHDAETVNVLRLVENLPLKLIDYMSEAEQTDLTAVCAIALCAMRWLLAASKILAAAKTVAEKDRALLQHTRQDYVSSTANLLSYNYAQSRWSSSQAIEKMIKGLLTVAGKEYPKAHDLSRLGKIMEQEIGVAPRKDCLKIGMCSTDARYDDTRTTLDDCLQANHAVLRLAEQFSKDDKVVELLDGARAK